MFGFFKRRRLKRLIHEAVLDAEPMHLLGILVYRHAKDPDLSPHQRDEANAQGKALLEQGEAFRAHVNAPEVQSAEQFLPYLAAIVVIKAGADKSPYDVKACSATVADMMATLTQSGTFGDPHAAMCSEVSSYISTFVGTKRPATL